MKLKSLFLGSAAAVGLSTGAFAADLATVVSSFDVCDSLGMSGLTISSSDDCLQISGGVTYEFRVGDYNGAAWLTNNTIFHPAEGRTLIDNDSQAASVGQQGVYVPVTIATGVMGAQVAAFTKPADTAVTKYVWIVNPIAPTAADPNANMDYRSRLDWWVQFVGASQSDFGAAKAVIKLADGDHEDFNVANESATAVPDYSTAATTRYGVELAEAYVSLGDTTKIIAGRRDASVFNSDDDAPFGFIGTFHSDEVDAGVDVFHDRLKMKNHVIQLYHTVGDTGITLSAGLENLYGDAYVAYGTAGALSSAASDGTAVGTLAYASDTFTGHISVAAGGILDGTIEDWKMHSGFTGTFDNFKIRGAFAGGSAGSGAVTSWNGLVSAEATFDMFTLTGALEAANRSDTGVTQWGGSVTGMADVTDEVSIGAAFRWYDSSNAANDETYQAALRLVAKLAENVKLTADAGVYSVGGAVVKPTNGTTVNANGAFYGSAELAWTPATSFSTSIKGEVTSLGGYRATFKASKTFD